MLAAAAMAQAEPLPGILQWVRDGEAVGSRPIVPPAVRIVGGEWDDLLASGQLDRMVTEVADLAEAMPQPLPVRRRAIAVLQACCDELRFADLGAKAQARIARALVRLASAPELPAATRGEALVGTAALPDRRERLDWRLEGQVRLRNYLRFHGANGSAGELELLPPIADYLGALGQHGVEALPLLLQLLADAKAPLLLRQRAIAAVRRIGPLAAPTAARQAFVQLLGCSSGSSELEDALLDAAGEFVGEDSRLLADHTCRRAVLAMLDHLEALPAHLAGRRITACLRLARHADVELETELFVACDRCRTRLPALGDPAVSAMASLASGRDNLFADKAGAEALLHLLEDFEAQDESRRRMSVLSICVTGLFREHASRFESCDDQAVRARVTAKGDQLAAIMAKSAYPAMLRAAKAWQKRGQAR